MPQPLKNQSLQLSLTASALQDFFLFQPTVFIGLIAHLTGLKLQDDIAAATRHLQQLGCDILGGAASQQGGYHDAQGGNNTAPPLRTARTRHRVHNSNNCGPQDAPSRQSRRPPPLNP